MIFLAAYGRLKAGQPAARKAAGLTNTRWRPDLHARLGAAPGSVTFRPLGPPDYRAVRPTPVGGRAGTPVMSPALTETVSTSALQSWLRRQT